MQDTVSMSTVCKLAQVFYQQLETRGQVDCALNAARGALLTAEHSAVAVRVLFMRLPLGLVMAGCRLGLSPLL